MRTEKSAGIYINEDKIFFCESVKKCNGGALIFYIVEVTYDNNILFNSVNIIFIYDRQSIVF